jgi:hypothetical protein
MADLNKPTRTASRGRQAVGVTLLGLASLALGAAVGFCFYALSLAHDSAEEAQNFVSFRRNTFVLAVLGVLALCAGLGLLGNENLVARLKRKRNQQGPPKVH